MGVSLQRSTEHRIDFEKPSETVPFAAAGGIGDSRAFPAALASGADGIYMGTAFLPTKECPIPDRIKENIVKASPDHPDLIRELLASPDPEEYMAVRGAREEMPFEKWIPAMERVHVKHRKWRDVKPMWEQGSEDLPSVGTRPKGPYSFACAYIDRVVSCKELIEGIVRGAEEILEKLLREWELKPMERR